jgi:hypothetical protein
MAQAGVVFVLLVQEGNDAKKEECPDTNKFKYTLYCVFKYRNVHKITHRSE